MLVHRRTPMIRRLDPEFWSVRLLAT